MMIHSMHCPQEILRVGNMGHNIAMPRIIDREHEDGNFWSPRLVVFIVIDKDVVVNGTWLLHLIMLCDCQDVGPADEHGVLRS